MNHIVIQSAFSDQERRINLTTIVYKDGYLSGDGRVTLGDTIISDDTVKVFKVNNCLIGFAGRYASGLNFVKWFEEWDTANQAQEELPFVTVKIPELLPDEDFQAVVAYPDGVVMSYEGGNMFYAITPPIALGSGTDFAYGAMDAGMSAEEAVKIACKRDVSSGGVVTTLTFDEEPEEITKEKLTEMSKEDIIELFFPEEPSEAEGTIVSEDVCGVEKEVSERIETLKTTDEATPNTKYSYEFKTHSICGDVDSVFVQFFIEGDIYVMFNIDDDWTDHTLTGLRYKYEWEPIATALGVEIKQKDSMKTLAKRCYKKAIKLLDEPCVSAIEACKFKGDLDKL